MVIVQVSITKILQDSYNLEPFVYASRPGAFTSTATFPAIFGWTVRSSSDPITIVDFLRLPITRYAEQSSYNDVVSTEASWWFDIANQILYFHVEHDSSTLYDEFAQGVSYGYCSGRPIDIDGSPYLNLVKGIPNISQQQDLTNYSLPALISGAVTLDNTGGLLDFFILLAIYGNRLNIFFLEDTPDRSAYSSSELIQIASVTVSNPKFSLQSLALQVKDLREAGGAKLPNELFSATDYPDIDDKHVNKPVPLAYGDIREIPLIITNGKATSGNVTYKAASVMTDFGDVYVKSGDVWTAASPVSSTLSTGDVTLAAADARDGTTPLEAKLVDCSGIANTRATDVIVDLNERADGTLYIASNYDTAEWEIEEAGISSIGLYIDKQKELYKIITEIQNGSNIGFRYEINANGLRTIRQDSESRDTVLHVPNTAIENRALLPVESDAETLAGTASVDYAKSYVDDSTLRVIDDSEADSVRTTYRNDGIADLEFLGVSASSAAEKAAFYLERFSTIRPVSSVTLVGCEYLQLRIYDLIMVDITPADFVDVDSGVIIGREYFGLKLVKILSIDPDLELRKNEITGVIIGDAAFETPFDIEVDGGVERLLDDSGEFMMVY